MIEEDLYEELPEPALPEREELYVDTESFPPPCPPSQDELYDDCISPPPPPLPPVIRVPPPPPPISPPPPTLSSVIANQRRGSESPVTRKKSSLTSAQPQSLDMSEILEKRKKLQKVGSRTLDSVHGSMDSSATDGAPPWQTKPMKKSSVDNFEQNKKDEKPEWMVKTLKRVGDRPTSVAESQDRSVVDKSGSLPFPIRLKKTGIALEKEDSENETTYPSAVTNCNDVSSTGSTPKKLPKPSPKPKLMHLVKHSDSSETSTPTQSPRNSIAPLIPKKPSVSHNGDVSVSPPDPRSLPKPGQDLSPSKLNHFPQSPGIPKRGGPAEHAPLEPTGPPPPPEEEDSSHLRPPPLIPPHHSVDSPPDVSLLPKPGLPPPNVRSLPKPGQSSPALAPRLSTEGLSVNNSSSPCSSPTRSSVSDVASKTNGEATTDVSTTVPRYRRRPLPVVDINNPPPKPHHSKPPSLPALGPQLLRPRSDSELENEVNSLLSDIDHKSDRVNVIEDYSADDIYDDVEPDSKHERAGVKVTLGGVTTTSSSDAYPGEDIYDDVAADHDKPPEPPPPEEDELYDDIQTEGKASKLTESVESVVSFASDSDEAFEPVADNDADSGGVPVEGGDVRMNKKEISKLKKQEKEREKQLEKERRLQKKKEEEERKLREKMESQRKKNFERTRKVFKLKGDEQAKLVVHTNCVISKAQKHFLTFNEGEQVSVLFMSAYQAPNKKEFPQGAWLVVKSDGTVGYVDRTHLDTSHIGGLDFGYGYGDGGEDLYEDIATNTTSQPFQASHPERQSLPPPSAPAPLPPGSPPQDTEDLECYDDVSGGGELVEEELYEELNS